MRQNRHIFFQLPLLFLFIFIISCKAGTDVAPGGSNLFITADPSEIGMNARSTLTVSGTNEDGTPIADGTRVSFRVDQGGSISPGTVQFQNGRATSTYLSSFITGEMTITATSGSVEASTTITVADDVQQKVFVSANPATFAAGGGTSIISAVVTDDSGQPIEGAGVSFSTTAGTMQSDGDFLQTNANGVVNDTLSTTEDATVTATTDEGFSGTTTVKVGEGRIVCHMTVSSTTPKVGQTVLFFDTSDDPASQAVRYHWDFGDASSADGRNVEHRYDRVGTFDVVHSVIDTNGNTTFCDPVSIQVSP